MTKRLLTILLILTSTLVDSQNDFCECCSYHSLQNRFTEYEIVFPPELIIKNNVKELIVYASGRLKDDTSQIGKIKVRKTLIKEHLEIKFQFDNKGYVTKLTWYNRMGKPHSLYLFERNAIGKVTKLTFSYLDSLEKVPFPSFGGETTVYSYDAKGNLIKEELLGQNGEDVPGSKSKYTAYSYDSKNRLVKKVNYTYYDAKSVYSHTTNIKYDDSNFSAESSTSNDGKEWVLEKQFYDSKWRILEEKSFMTKTKEPYSTSKNKYNSDGQLISYFVKSRGGECPETTGFFDLYSYNEAKLIKTIAHTFDKYTCEMTFEYK